MRVYCIEAEHAKKMGKRAEMNIQHEAGLAQRLAPKTCKPSNIERLENRVQTHAILIVKDVVPLNGIAVDKDEIDLSGLNAKRPNKLVDRAVLV